MPGLHHRVPLLLPAAVSVWVLWLPSARATVGGDADLSLIGVTPDGRWVCAILQPGDASDAAFVWAYDRQQNVLLKSGDLGSAYGSDPAERSLVRALTRGCDRDRIRRLKGKERSELGITVTRETLRAEREYSEQWQSHYRRRVVRVTVLVGEKPLGSVEVGVIKAPGGSASPPRVTVWSLAEPAPASYIAKVSYLGDAFETGYWLEEVVLPPGATTRDAGLPELVEALTPPSKRRSFANLANRAGMFHYRDAKSQARKVDPKRFEILIGMARDNFADAAAIDPTWFLAFTNLASVEALLGRHAEMLAALEAAGKLDREETASRMRGDRDYGAVRRRADFQELLLRLTANE